MSKRLIAMLLVALLGVGSVARGGSIFSDADVLNAVKERRERIGGLTVEMEVSVWTGRSGGWSRRSLELTNPPELVRKFKIDSNQSSSRIRRSQISGPMQHPYDEEFAWDGTIATSLARPPASLAEKPLEGTVQSERPVYFRIHYPLTVIESAYFDEYQDLVGLMTDIPEGWAASELVLTDGSIEIGGEMISSVTLERTLVRPDGESRDIRIVFAPKHGFVPVLVSQSFRANSVYYSGLQELRADTIAVNGGIHYIKDATLFQQNDFGHELMKAVTKFHLTTYQPAQTFASDYFRIKFERGTHVIDDVADRMYVAGEFEWVWDGEAGMTRVPMDDAVQELNGTDEVADMEPGRERMYAYLALGIGIALLFAIGVSVIRKNRKARVQ